MPIPKFNFISEKQIGDKPDGNSCWRVSLHASKSTPSLYFPSDMVHALEMDGKYFQLFADLEKKAIGWRVIEGQTELESISNARLANRNKQSGAILFGIGRLIKALNYEVTKSIPGLEVKTYMSPLLKGDISYVILPSPEKPYQEKEADSK